MGCPGNNTIAELVCGALPVPDAETVERHVADCAACRRMVGALAASSLGRVTRGGATPSTCATMPGTPGDADPVPLRAGASIARYRVLELLGAGGMGIVYAAHNPELDRAVALKLLLPELADDPGAARELLLVEAQAMARLRHPNLVTVHDVGTDGDRVYIAMELVAGQTLRGWLSKPRSFAEVLRVMTAAGRGLAAAHDGGLVHRDFKPENVLCGGGGQVCVSDFGLALPTGALAGHVAGTPGYMAPEQRAGAAPDPRADQYSFCVVLDEAVRRPPRWLARLCTRGRAADPAARFPSMHALLDELTRDRGRVRRRAVTALAAVAVLATVTGGVLAFGPSRAAPPPCRGAAAELAAVWNPAHRAAIQRAILATGVPFAADTWARVERSLDDHARRWVAMHTETCEATAVHHSQSPALLDRRMACLAGRKADLEAAVNVLAGVDRDGVAGALAIADLPGLEACADGGGLSELGVAGPRHDELRRDLARAAALARAGTLRAAIELAGRTAEAAAALGDGPLEAEARYAHAESLEASGDTAAARDGYERTLAAAARSGHAAFEARALAQLALMAAPSNDARIGREYAAHAVAIAERLRGDPLLEAMARETYARVLFGSDHEAGLAQLAQGEARLAEAMRLLPAAAVADVRIAYLQVRADLELLAADSLAREATVLRVAEETYGPDHPKVAAVLQEMIQHAMNDGQLETARGYARRIALILAPYPSHDSAMRDIEMRLETDPARRRVLLEALVHDEETTGGTHTPRLANLLSKLAEVLLELEAVEPGLVAIDRAIAIWDETFHGRYELLVNDLVTKAEFHIMQGDFEAAAAAGERAMALAERGQVRGLVTAMAQLMMAEVYFHVERWADSARIFDEQAGFMRLVMGDDPSMAAFDFMQAAAHWELGHDRAANLALARAAYARYRKVPDRDPGAITVMEAWLSNH